MAYMKNLIGVLCMLLALPAIGQVKKDSVSIDMTVLISEQKIMLGNEVYYKMTKDDLKNEGIEGKLK
jgi:hypothetical protein